MAGKYTSSSSRYREQFRLVTVKLPHLSDESIKRQIQERYGRIDYTVLARQPLLVPIQNVLKPTTFLVDAILLNKNVPKSTMLDASKPVKFDSALTELDVHDCFIYSRDQMEKIADKAPKTLDGIDVHPLSMDVLHEFQYLPAVDTAVKVMGSFVFKFVEFLVVLLDGPDTPLSEFESSIVALMENPVSLVGTQLEKFIILIDQLNSLVKNTLEVIEYICALTLLSDTEYHNKDLLSMGVYWVVLTVVVCYVQINVIKDMGNENNLPDGPSEISEFMQWFTHSSDGHQFIIDGSTQSQVDLGRVFRGKAVLMVVTDLHYMSMWFLKGRYMRSGDEESLILIDPLAAQQKKLGFVSRGDMNELTIVNRKHFPFKSLEFESDGGDAEPAFHTELYEEFEGGGYRRHRPNQKAASRSKKPANGFQGLLQKKKRGK
ncbi:hypothetical protein L6164_013109 [Bauhinia variegata]|uniref:Uncharacterized protein n=1 Tax=Bauhinia variegata TaxID=167791 RepID=A0ACB9PCF0_BAUVA|nr:hypothetical protein L6164_013109 [Bauhinia variegata]